MKFKKVLSKWSQQINNSSQNKIRDKNSHSHERKANHPLQKNHLKNTASPHPLPAILVGRNTHLRLGTG